MRVEEVTGETSKMGKRAAGMVERQKRSFARPNAPPPRRWAKAACLLWLLPRPSSSGNTVTWTFLTGRIRRFRPRLRAIRAASLLILVQCHFFSRPAINEAKAQQRA